MDPTRERLLEEFRDKEARREYADEFLDASIALQIKTLRQERKLTQKALADLAGMKQSRISTMEKVDYSSWSVQTLRRLAEAFDLPLIIRFESWANLLRDITRLGRKDLDRPSFDRDPMFQGRSITRAESGSSDSGGDVLPFPIEKGRFVPVSLQQRA